VLLMEKMSVKDTYVHHTYEHAKLPFMPHSDSPASSRLVVVGFDQAVKAWSTQNSRPCMQPDHLFYWCNA